MIVEQQKRDKDQNKPRPDNKIDAILNIGNLKDYKCNKNLFFYIIKLKLIIYNL